MEAVVLKILVMIAFCISAAAFLYGAFKLLDGKVPEFFKYHVYAAGCYTLEELWVIVNAIFGTALAEGLATVRLIGFFGCLCFMLSANINTKKPSDRKRNTRAGIISLLAPAVLMLFYALYLITPNARGKVSENIIGFMALSPALPVSWFNLKALILKTDDKTVTAIHILSLTFCLANFAYSFINVFVSTAVMTACDIIYALLILAIIILCAKGASKCKT